MTPAGGMTAVAEWLAPLHIPLIRRAALTLLVAGTTFSVLGVVLVTLNLTVMRFALLHVGLLGAAVAAVAGWEPLAGGAVAIAAAAFLLGPTGDRLRLAPSATSALFMTGSLALAFALFYKAGLPAMEIFSLFAGNVLTVTRVEAWAAASLGVIIAVGAVVAYRELQAVLYNRDLARALGVPADAVYYVLLGLVGLAMALAIRLVGALLVDALILLPAMAALPLARSLGQALGLAALFGFLTSLGGLGASLALDMPIGASVGLAGVAVLAVAHGAGRLVGRRRAQQPPASEAGEEWHR